MKKTLCIIAAAVILLLCIAGCGKTEPSVVPEEGEFANDVLEIADKDGKHLGDILRYGYCSVTDKGIFYPKNASPDNNLKKEFHFFNPETGEDTLLGTIDNVYYEASYARTEIGDKMYVITIGGDQLDDTPDPMYVTEFDLVNAKMKTTLISENGFSYCSASNRGGKLLVMNHDQTDTELNDTIIEFDPTINVVKTPLIFALPATMEGDTLRAVYCNENSIYLLRIHAKSQTDFKVFVDEYDSMYHKLSETDVTDILADAVLKSHIVEEDIPNEMKQSVSNFAVIDGKYLFYENYSSTRCLADIETGQQLFEDYSLIDGSLGSGDKVFFKTYATQNGEKDNPVWKLKDDGTLEQTHPDFRNSKYSIIGGSVSLNGSSVFEVYYVNPENRNDTLPYKMFWYPAE